MIATVRESVNQVMEQMQNMEGMPGMGMDGMPVWTASSMEECWSRLIPLTDWL